ncbi:MAG TPA: D-erythronate dehydrogenase [Acidobacteriaceae bacterium]|nr:D-erythronate dehydrogenase [Acidobacteriaceae bacterium]
MKVLITGGAGFLGTLLARALLARRQLAGQSIHELALADLAPPAPDLLADARVRALTGALMNQCPGLSRDRFDAVFHLAAAVSAECEANFDLGMQSNLDTTRALLDAVRAADNTPRVIFASSIAVFGADPGLPMPAVIRADTLPTPQSSYGIQKYICEQLIADYTRKSFIDGRNVRLMTVVVRPGRPNGAASSFLSGIVREPLNGEQAVCPVPPEMTVALASPARTIEALIAVAEASREALGGRIALNLPGLTVSVGEMLDALEAVAGTKTRGRVRFQPDAAIARIVGGWPAAFDNSRALRLGLKPDPDFLSIVRAFVDDRAAETENSAISRP